MFNGPFFHDEMTALAGFEQSYADRLTAMGRKAPKLLIIEVPFEDTLRWLGIDPDALGDLIKRVTAQFADETCSVPRSPHVDEFRELKLRVTTW